MVNFNKNINKTCSFYVSDWHLITMILPHINKSINDGKKITTILEQDSSEKIKILVSKLNLKNDRQILRINWEKTDTPKEKIKDILKNNSNDKLEIIVSGSVNYIENVNTLIETYVDNNNADTNIEIINCYSLEEKVDISQILKKHTHVLNTAGEKETSEYIKETVNK